MRSYALFLALAVLHARAATIPAPENEKKIPVAHDALDDVSLDNNESEQELVKPADPVKEIENNLRNSVPENVPVKIIEEQPIIKKVPLKEDSNDYVPDNDDSTNIKRVEIDLNNPGPPQRQEHDSQKPVAYHSYIDKERAVAAIKQSIAESQNIFTRGIHDVTQKFKYYFATNDELNEVTKNIQSLRHNFDAEVVKLSNTINHYLKPESEAGQKVEIPSQIKEVENSLKSLETNFNYGVGMLSEGVELLTILKEEDDQNLKIAGKADTDNTATVTQTGTATGTAPANAGTNPAGPTVSNPVIDFIQTVNTTVINAFTSLQNTIQNFINPTQNVNNNQVTEESAQTGFNPANIFQGIQNIFQQNQNSQQQTGTAPAGTQGDDPGATERPNILQQIQTSLQTNPITQFISGVNQGISNLFQGRPQQTPQQVNQVATASSQPAAAAPAAQGFNSVPAAPAQAEPAKPAKEPEQVQNAPAQDPVQSVPAQSGPIQQIVQNNPIVKGITDAVQKIQGISNPTKPRDAVVENSDSKGHGGSNSGDSVSGVDEVKEAPVKEVPVKDAQPEKIPEATKVKEQPEKIPEIKDGAEPSAEPNKTE